jgi:proline racemase/trans-L-3-hydroxyproline dehydratase
MSTYTISFVDAHVAGEPLRLITSAPFLKGKTIVEKREYMKQNYDFIRTAVMMEPRGHADMYGAVLTEATDPNADAGIVFIDTALYNNMCGHGSIAIGTILVELGLVPVQEPVTKVVLETGAGLVTVHVTVSNGKAIGATLQGVPSFLFKSNIPLNVLDREIMIDIVYGGNFFAMVEIPQLGLDFTKEHLSEFIRYGKEIRCLANETIDFMHPEKPHINTIDDVLFVNGPNFNQDTYKSLCFLGEAQIDRSPCGTGTCARMAALYARGELSKNEPFLHESIIGTVFEGKVIEETNVGALPAVIPTVKSRAYITAMGQLFIDDQDPLKHGFMIK